MGKGSSVANQGGGMFDHTGLQRSSPHYVHALCLSQEIDPFVSGDDGLPPLTLRILSLQQVMELQKDYTIKSFFKDLRRY